MPTLHPSVQPLVPDKIPSQESPQSPEWTHAMTTLMGLPSIVIRARKPHQEVDQIP